MAKYNFDLKQRSNYIAIRHLLRYRGSNEKFDICQAIRHELKHVEKERSAEWRYKKMDICHWGDEKPWTLYPFGQKEICIDRSYEKIDSRCKFVMSDSLFLSGYALLYSGDKIRRIYNGDVWTVRHKNDPLRVVRTRCDECAHNSYSRRGEWIGRDYNECVVTGRPKAVICYSTKCVTKELRHLCKQYNLKIILMSNGTVNTVSVAEH